MIPVIRIRNEIMILVNMKKKRIIIKSASPHIFHLVVFVFFNSLSCSDSLVECDAHIVSTSRDLN